MLLSSRALWISAALNVLLLLGVAYSWLKVGPQMKQELAEARAPQFIQEVRVLGVARSAGSVREVSRATRRIVFSFYVTEKFQNIGYELKDASGTVRSHEVLPAPPKEVSTEGHISLSTASLKPGAYEIGFWGVGGGGEVPIGQSKFRITSE
jgi:hypothetical protein